MAQPTAIAVNIQDAKPTHKSTPLPTRPHKPLHSGSMSQYQLSTIDESRNASTPTMSLNAFQEKMSRVEGTARKSFNSTITQIKELAAVQKQHSQLGTYSPPKYLLLNCLRVNWYMLSIDIKYHSLIHSQIKCFVYTVCPYLFPNPSPYPTPYQDANRRSCSKPKSPITTMLPPISNLKAMQ